MMFSLIEAKRIIILAEKIETNDLLEKTTWGSCKFTFYKNTEIMTVVESLFTQEFPELLDQKSYLLFESIQRSTFSLNTGVVDMCVGREIFAAQR